MQKAGAGDLREAANLFVTLWPALAALFISHGVSFVTNFIGNKEYHYKTVREQMTAPYSRISLMHVTLIVGGFITMILRDPMPVLLIFMVAKIIIDVRSHMKEHNVIKEYDKTKGGE